MFRVEPDESGVALLESSQPEFQPFAAWVNLGLIQFVFPNVSRFAADTASGTSVVSRRTRDFTARDYKIAPRWQIAFVLNDPDQRC
jgi:hypothetical protein